MSTNEVRYEIRTVDGANYKIDTLEEVLSYSNPQSRRIVKLSISANKQKNTHLFTQNLTLSLFDMTLYDKSCILSPQVSAKKALLARIFYNS